jgi:hypothetical protein
MIGILVEGEPVLCCGKPYLLRERSDPPGFCILADVEEREIFVHESKIEDSGLQADVAWSCSLADRDSKSSSGPS